MVINICDQTIVLSNLTFNAFYIFVHLYYHFLQVGVGFRQICDWMLWLKRQEETIDGQADVLIFPNIESGNTFYKSVSLFANADMAGLLQGPVCPVVLPSRSDSGLSKYYSMAMACLTCQ